MGYWMELQCASRRSSGCYSNRQIDVPMGMTKNVSQIAISQTIAYLALEAAKFGWVYDKQLKDYICPKCK